MSPKEPAFDLGLAYRDPAAAFAGPETLRGHPALPRGQKIELLRRWAYDASNSALQRERA